MCWEKGEKTLGPVVGLGRAETEGSCRVLLPSPSVPRAVLLPGAALSDVPVGPSFITPRSFAQKLSRKSCSASTAPQVGFGCWELQAVQDRPLPTPGALTLGELGRVRPPLAVSNSLHQQAVRIASSQPGLCSAGSAAGSCRVAELPAGSCAVALPTSWLLVAVLPAESILMRQLHSAHCNAICPSVFEESFCSLHRGICRHFPAPLLPVL